MSLCYRQESELRLIEASLRQSDPDLRKMFDMFGRLYTGQGMPAWEQTPSRQGGFQQTAWIVAALIAIAAAFGTLLRAPLTLVTTTRRAGIRPQNPTSENTRHGGEASDPQDPPRPAS